MNDILINIISVVVTAVVLPLISIAGAQLIKLINKKIGDKQSAKFLGDATNIVTNAVRCVFQTYVDSLKKAGSFDAVAQATALTKAKDLVLSELSTEVKEYITTNFGDLESWLTTQIESTINLLKNK
jgi:uncharacterized membrane protein